MRNRNWWRRNADPIRTTSLFVALGMFIGANVSQVLGMGGLRSAFAGLLSGGLMAGTLAVFELFIVRSDAAAGLRQAPLATYVLVRTLFYLLVIVAFMRFTEILLFPQERWGWLQGEFLLAFGIAAAFGLVMSFFLAMQRMLGPGVLGRFMTGVYHHPREEERVFLLMDIADSTRIAERIGHVEFHRLLNRFFFDVTGPVRDHGGEVYRYVGDEIIVTWPMLAGSGNGRCVQCYLDIVDLMAERAPLYREAFGLVPSFRTALHGGVVVAGEVGDWKQEIMFLGDTMNTAARMEGACKEAGVPMLISAELLQHLSLPEGVSAEPVPGIELRGKERETELFTLRRE
jgi:adenylate cyclase